MLSVASAAAGIPRFHEVLLDAVSASLAERQVVLGGPFRARMALDAKTHPGVLLESIHDTIENRDGVRTKIVLVEFETHFLEVQCLDCCGRRLRGFGAGAVGAAAVRVSPAQQAVRVPVSLVAARLRELQRHRRDKHPDAVVETKKVSTPTRRTPRN